MPNFNFIDPEKNKQTAKEIKNGTYTPDAIDQPTTNPSASAQSNNNYNPTENRFTAVNPDNAQNNLDWINSQKSQTSQPSQNTQNEAQQAALARQEREARKAQEAAAKQEREAREAQEELQAQQATAAKQEREANEQRAQSQERDIIEDQRIQERIEERIENPIINQAEAESTNSSNYGEFVLPEKVPEAGPSEGQGPAIYTNPETGFTWRDQFQQYEQSNGQWTEGEQERNNQSTSVNEVSSDAQDMEDISFDLPDKLPEAGVDIYSSSLSQINAVGNVQESIIGIDPSKFFSELDAGRISPEAQLNIGAYLEELTQESLVDFSLKGSSGYSIGMTDSGNIIILHGKAGLGNARLDVDTPDSKFEIGIGIDSGKPTGGINQVTINGEVSAFDANGQAAFINPNTGEIWQVSGGLGVLNAEASLSVSQTGGFPLGFPSPGAGASWLDLDLGGKYITPPIIEIGSGNQLHISNNQIGLDISIELGTNPFSGDLELTFGENINEGIPYLWSDYDYNFVLYSAILKELESSGSLSPELSSIKDLLQYQMTSNTQAHDYVIPFTNADYVAEYEKIVLDANQCVIKSENLCETINSNHN